MRFVTALVLLSMAGIPQALGQSAPAKMPPPMPALPTMPNPPPAPNKSQSSSQPIMSPRPAAVAGNPPKQVVSQQQAVSLFVTLCASATPDLKRIKASADKEGWQATSSSSPSAKAENIDASWLLSLDGKVFLNFSDRKVGSVRIISCDVRIMEADLAGVVAELGQQLKSAGYKPSASDKSHARLSFATDMNAATKAVELATAFSTTIEEKK